MADVLRENREPRERGVCDVDVATVAPVEKGKRSRTVEVVFVV